MTRHLQYNNKKAEGVPLTREQLRARLKKHDKNRDNRLTKAELKEALKELGLGSVAANWRAWRCFHEADADRDGLINEDELEDLIDYLQSQGYKPTNCTRN